MLCWPLIIMNFPALIASHEVGGSLRSRLFLSTGVRHTFCSCLTSPIWTRVLFMSSTNDLCSVQMIKSSCAMMHWLIFTLVASVSNKKHALWFCQNSLRMLANFSKSSVGGTDLDVPVCAVVMPEAAASPSAILSGPLGLLLFRVPSPLSLDWAGFLFWASALEEPGRDPPLPLFGVVSPHSTPAGCHFMPFLVEAAFAAVTIAYLSSVCHTPRNLLTTKRAVPSCHGRSCLLMKSSFRLSISVPYSAAMRVTTSNFPCCCLTSMTMEWLWLVALPLSSTSLRTITMKCSRWSSMLSTFSLMFHV